MVSVWTPHYSNLGLKDLSLGTNISILVPGSIGAIDKGHDIDRESDTICTT